MAMASFRLLPLALLLSACISALVLAGAHARTPLLEQTIRLPSQRAQAAGQAEDDSVGTRWAVLIAGSNGYYNYRHQVYLRYDSVAYCSVCSGRSRLPAILSILRSGLSVNSLRASPCK
jgi:legumain